ncbi:MAG: hypothetical protein IKN43_15405 [Selenomonadaceae bacterium]|nr:hypothetical protein [Selenomonadaceae bacterium]
MAENETKNKEQSTVADTEDNKEKNRKNYKFLAVVIPLILILLAICGYVAFLIVGQKDKPTKKEPATIGVVRIKDAIKSHKDFGEIGKLRERYEEVLTDIAELSAPRMIKLPETEKVAFDDSVKQKQAQELIDKVAKLEEKRRSEVEKYVKATEAEYESKRGEIDARYLHAIADLRMKLDNADILGLSPEKINELAYQLRQLQKERGETQDALKMEREREIYAYGEKVIANLSGEMSSIDKEAERLKADAALKESETAARNMALMEEALGGDRIALLREKEDELSKIKEELAALEDRIFSDIAGMAAKHAIAKNLELVVADVSVNLKEKIPLENFNNDDKPSEKVITLNAIDITDEVIADLTK